MMSIKQVFTFLLVVLLGYKAQAQIAPPNLQAIDRKYMHLLTNNKPNIIIYRDTVYQGARAFKSLFFNTRNPQIIDLYYLHQQNKIAGNFCSVLGTIGILVGVQMVSNRKSTTSQQTNGWMITGAGFASAVTGGYLLTKSKTQLLIATALFNKQIQKSTTHLETATNGLGLCLKW